MAIGDSLAGDGVAGFDPTVTTTNPTATRASAVLIDLQTRTVLLDDNGFTRGMDPVDQEVTISLGFAKGSITSSPDAGIDVDRIRLAPSPALQAIGRDEVLVRCAGPIARGDIEIRNVATTRALGRITLVVDYFNVRTGRPGPRVQVTV